MRILVMTLVGMVLAWPATAGNWADDLAGALQPRHNGLALAAPNLSADIRTAPHTVVDTARLAVAAGGLKVQGVVERSLAGSFSGSRLGFGPNLRSPFLSQLGRTDGVHLRLADDRGMVAGAFGVDDRGRAIAAAEIVSGDDSFAIQAGHITMPGADTTAFAGGRLDLARAGRAQLSLRWHGAIHPKGGTREPESAAAVALALPALWRAGDQMNAWIARPLSQGFGPTPPQAALSYELPLALGDLTCSSRLRTDGPGRAELRMSWALSW